MDITNQFVVPLAPEEAWTVLLDIRRIIPAVPGAELLDVVDDRTYKGKVSVKLGPVALAFVGTARFEELDAAARRAKVLAKGSDAKGRGGATSLVQFRLEPVKDGTKVILETNLNLSGSVAQYGRGTGVIQGVAAQLTSQFAQNLKAMLERERIGSEAEPIPGAASNPTASGPGSTGETRQLSAIPGSTLSPTSAMAGTPAAHDVDLALSDASAATPAIARITAAACRVEAAAARIDALVGRAENAVAHAESTLATLLRSTRPPAPVLKPAKPISGFSLLLGVLWNMLAGLFKKKEKV